MKQRIAFVAALFALLPVLSFAGVLTGTTDPNQFANMIDWCQFGCSGAQYPTPQAWTGSNGDTGLVGLMSTQQGFYNLQQGTSWYGLFDGNMGLVYNGAFYGNTPTDIVIQFDQGEAGGGAWVEDNFLSYPYTATVTAYDSSLMPIGSYMVTSAANDPAMFVGLTDTAPDIWALQFDVSSQGAINYGDNPDFAIGTAKYGAVVPEPASMLLMGLGLVGVGWVARRRKG